MSASTLDRNAAVSHVRAYIVGGAFDDVAALRAALEVIRASGTSSDVVGLAVPIPGNPLDESVAAEIIARRSEPTGFGAWVRVVIDPHAPTVPTYQEQVSGRNVPLAFALLDDLATWVGACGYMRVTADDGRSTWVLGRPNHAAAVQGGASGARGDVLASIGVPAAQLAAYRALLLEGLAVVTTCETDPGRTKRDADAFQRHGGRATFVVPVAPVPVARI